MDHDPTVCKCSIDLLVFLVNGLAFSTLAGLGSALVYAVGYLIKIQIYNSQTRSDFPTPCRTPDMSQHGSWKWHQRPCNRTSAKSLPLPDALPLRALLPPPEQIGGIKAHVDLEGLYPRREVGGIKTPPVDLEGLYPRRETQTIPLLNAQTLRDTLLAHGDLPGSVTNPV
jgi:hypothetical protein